MKVIDFCGDYRPPNIANTLRFIQDGLVENVLTQLGKS
jgi:hypothetical protein